MVIFKKSDLACSICHMIIHDPIDFPCHCTICHKHLKDDSVKDGLITCVNCDEEFVVKDLKYKANRYVKTILDSEDYLSDEEKSIKRNLYTLTYQFEELYFQFKQEHSAFELNSHEHFAEIKRQLDIHREALKEKIDEIYMAMIKQAEENEQIFKRKLNVNEFDADKERERLDETFRNVELTIVKARQLQEASQTNFSDLQSKMEELNFVSSQIRKCAFEANKDFAKSSFGHLKLSNLKRYIVSASRDKTIKIWDLETNECIRTLVGHTDAVKCVEILPTSQLISCSNDKSIKIWNTGTGECVKTLTGHADLVTCLKVLPDNRVASGSWKVIKVWDFNSGQCELALHGHTCWVKCLIVLPNGTLVSCSQDKTIKIWNLTDGACIKTLTGHSESVYGLLFLKDGHLASCSQDKSIKIWNVYSGECIRTLESHSNWVWGLSMTDTFDLISCSKDKTIKIWDLTSGHCVRTLHGHTRRVASISKYTNSLIASGSSDNTIKFWNLETGECVKTLYGHADVVHCIFII